MANGGHLKIAHDFNNLLACILGGVSFALADLPSNHPAYSSLVIAEQATNKAADLTHQLLAYAGKGKFLVTRFDLSTLIRDMVKLLQTSIPKFVELQLDLSTDLPWIEADASQVQQIVMNLVINGAESVGPEGGSLQVATGSASRASAHGDKTGVEVWMEVRDSGCGMTEAVRTRIFDPFFTTKSTGRGLDLAAVSGIVRAHQGRMEVESAPGQGSIFRREALRCNREATRVGRRARQRHDLSSGRRAIAPSVGAGDSGTLRLPRVGGPRWTPGCQFADAPGLPSAGPRAFLLADEEWCSCS